IKDRKGTENVAADHLSRIEKEETSDDSEVDDNFPGETFMKINTEDDPWFVDFANYLVSDIIPKGMTYQQKNKFFYDIKHYFWEEPYLFKQVVKQQGFDIIMKQQVVVDLTVCRSSEFNAIFTEVMGLHIYFHITRFEVTAAMLTVFDPWIKESTGLVLCDGPRHVSGSDWWFDKGGFKYMFMLLYGLYCTLLLLVVNTHDNIAWAQSKVLSTNQKDVYAAHNKSEVSTVRLYRGLMVKVVYIMLHICVSGVSICTCMRTNELERLGLNYKKE
ncbi:hypothetical protein Tco_0617082, partial [Tanacetum coccineum]